MVLFREPLRSFVLSAVKHNGDCVKVIGLNKACHMGERGRGSSKPAGNQAPSKGLGCLFFVSTDNRAKAVYLTDEDTWSYGYDMLI